MSRRGRKNQNNGNPPSNRPVATLTQSVTQSLSFSGPLPPPGLLQKYNEVIPNGAERIMAMAERQSAHRENLENMVISGNVASQKRGSIFAFIVSLVAIIGGFALIIMGKDAYGLAAIISSLATLAGVFVYARYQQRKERQDKADALTLRRQN